MWLRPKIFDMDASDSVINILFLDEISAAPQSVQAAAYQITLDRTVGEHKLPENCIVIAAGNRITDRSVAFNMPKALANRLCHIEVKGEASGWHDWAVAAGIHPLVTSFLDYNSASLTRFDPAEDNLAFPTPRSWEMVSNILSAVSSDIGKVYPLIAGCIFRYLRRGYEALPSCLVIFTDGRGEYPPEEEAMGIPVLWIISGREKAPTWGSIAKK